MRRALGSFAIIRSGMLSLMALHVTRDEFDARIAAACAAMRADGLDALLLFAPESQYYLTGYDTSGYVFFQCLVLTADGGLVLLTRRPDLQQARHTSIIEDIRLWYDADGKDPTEELLAILAETGLAAGRIGVELDSFGLSARNHGRLRERLSGCRLEDGSHIVRRLRLVKSEAELAYVRRAAGLADDAMLAMLECAGPGVFEGEINAAGVGAMLAGGGDMPPSGPVMGSGDRALLIRSATGHRTLDAVDQLTIEFAASYRHYCACLMRTVPIGREDPRQRAMFEATREAMAAMTEAVQAGRPLGEIDVAHRAAFDGSGFGHARMAACGYSLGATYKPTWMDVPPMLYTGNATLAEPGMVLFLHAILVDAEAGLAMSLGRTLVVRDGPAEVLTRLDPEFEVLS